MVYATNRAAKAVVWVATDFTDEYRKVLDWLSENTPESISFFGLEIELWRIGSSDPAPKFNVVCKPNELTKIERAGGLSEPTETTGTSTPASPRSLSGLLQMGTNVGAAACES